MAVDQDTQWCRNLINMVKTGGMWAVPRSGLVFHKVSDNELVLSAELPYDAAMPVSAERLWDTQEADFQLIKKKFAKAGVTVRKAGEAP